MLPFMGLHSLIDFNPKRTEIKPHEAEPMTKEEIKNRLKEMRGIIFRNIDEHDLLK